MSRRVERVFDVNLRAGQKRQVSVPIPETFTGLQIVIERTPLETLPRNVDVGKVTLTAIIPAAGRVKLGGITFAGGVADFTNIRPGRIGLWSTHRTRVPDGIPVVLIEFEAIGDFDLIAHLDIFT